MHDASWYKFRYDTRTVKSTAKRREIRIGRSCAWAAAFGPAAPVDLKIDYNNDRMQESGSRLSMEVLPKQKYYMYMCRCKLSLVHISLWNRLEDTAAVKNMRS